MTDQTRIRARPPDYQQGLDPPSEHQEGEVGRGALASLDRKTETDAMAWMLLQAFMNQKDVRAWRAYQNVVMISFETKTAADEFHRFILSAKGRT